MARDAIKAADDGVKRWFDGEVHEGLIQKTDNGPQYIALQFKSSMKLLRISLEGIQKHTPEDYENIESFHSSLKADYVWPYKFWVYNKISATIEKFFKDYDEFRSHSSNDYVPPKEFRT